jgi:hypothetical protein
MLCCAAALSAPASTEPCDASDWITARGHDRQTAARRNAATVTVGDGADLLRLLTEGEGCAEVDLRLDCGEKYRTEVGLGDNGTRRGRHQAALSVTRRYQRSTPRIPRCSNLKRVAYPRGQAELRQVRREVDPLGWKDGPRSTVRNGRRAKSRVPANVFVVPLGGSTRPCDGGGPLMVTRTERTVPQRVRQWLRSLGRRPGVRWRQAGPGSSPETTGPGFASV